MRAFIAVDPSKEIRAKLEALQPALELEGVKLVEPENLHLTLAFIGEISEALAQQVEEAMNGIKARGFELKIREVGVFPTPNFIRVVWVGAEGDGLKALYDELADALRKLGLKPDPLSPHITIARVKNPVAKEGVKSFLEKHAGVELGACRISTLALYQSILTPEGPVYKKVYEKPLG